MCSLAGAKQALYQNCDLMLAAPLSEAAIDLACGLPAATHTAHTSALCGSQHVVCRKQNIPLAKDVSANSRASA